MTNPAPTIRPPEVRHIMGMPIGIDVRDPVAIDVEPAFAWLREVDATFSTYREDSDISRLDRGELTLPECRPEVDEVLTRCLALGQATRGFFSVRPAGRLDPAGVVKGGRPRGRATLRCGRPALLHQRGRRRARLRAPGAG
jgi:thiamine biosynthesis lipoprotein